MQDAKLQQSTLHLPLNVRLGLLLRFCSFHLDKVISTVRAGEASAQESRMTIAALREEIYLSSEEAFRKDDWTVPIDASLLATQKQIEGLLLSLKGGGRNREAEGYAEEVLAIVKSVDCKLCCKSERICTGDHRLDSIVVDEGGLCFRWILNITEFAEEIATELYDPIIRRLKLRVPDVAFGTSLRKSPRPHGLNHPSQLAAKTEFLPIEDDNKFAPTVVKLFVTDQFDFASWLALFYVVMHEFVCHAFQQLANPGLRDRPADCPFSEGWMDALTQRSLRDALDRPSRRVPRELMGFKEQCLAQAQSLYAARYADDAPIRPHRLRRGAEAYERVWSCFAYNADEAEAERSIEFSLMLNLIATEEQLEEITTLVLQTLPRLEVPGYHSRSRAVFKAFQDFLDSADTVKLIDALSVAGGFDAWN